MKTVFLKGLCGLSLVMMPEAVFASSANNLKSVSSHQYTHLIETYQSQTFEPMSQTALFSEQSASISNFPKMAKVYFISKDGEQVFGSAGGNNTFEDPTIKQCIGDGYKYNASNCTNGLPADTCPYNIGYFKICCDVAYNYTEENCSLLNKSSSCGNKYKCDCTEEKYPVTVNSCTSPQIPTTESGASCTVNAQIRYTQCVCPTGVNASYGCETYYAAPCDTVCKKAKSDNCDNRTAVQTPYGCEKYYADCASKCEKAYTDNCRNRIAVSAPNGCEKYYADCSSKCEIAKEKPAENCDNRAAVSAPYGCEKPYADCPSKCEKAYANNCRNRTAVSAPAGCESYYADCSSKCEVAKEIKQEIAIGAILYGDGIVTKSVLSGKVPIGVVFDVENRLAVALSDVHGLGEEGSEYLIWGESYRNDFYDIPDLENCTDHSTAFTSCGTDGRANTDKILACRSLGHLCGNVEAAEACYYYTPRLSCSKDFCKQGKWFLPSMRDLYNIYKYKDMINTTLTSIGKYKIHETMRYWSSTERDDKYVWTIYMNDDGWGYKYSYTYKDAYGVVVRPVVAF